MGTEDRGVTRRQESRDGVYRLWFKNLGWEGRGERRQHLEGVKLNM